MQKRIVVLALGLAAMLCAQESRTAEAMLGRGLHQEQIEGNVPAAIATYKGILAQTAVSRATAAQALFHLGVCYQKAGNAEARKAFEKVVSDYSDQQELASLAKTKLAAIGPTHGGNTGITVRRVITDVGTNSPWSISADGRLMSFSHYDTGNVGVRDLETGEDRILTPYGTWDNTKGYTDQNAISRDGRSVAFWHYMYHGTKGELRVIGTDGKNERTLFRAKEGEWGIPADWSPDGKYVAVQLERPANNSMSEGDTDFSIVSMVDGSARVLKTIHYLRRHRPRIQFSPDGQYVAYDYPREPGSPKADIYVSPVNGGQEATVASHQALDVFMGWAPDGSVLFTSDRSGSVGLWAVKVVRGKQSGEPDLVKPNTGAIHSLGVTRAGTLYYRFVNSKSNAFVADIDTATGKLLRQPTLLTDRITDTTECPAWSPDGKRIAYVVQVPGTGSIIRIRTVASGQERQILSQAKLFGQPRWAIDGDSILFVGETANARPGLVRISEKTGDATVLTETPYPFDWSPDATHVFMAVRGEVVQKIVRRDLPSGDEHVLYTGPRLARALSVSPDGNLLAFVLSPEKSNDRSTLCVMLAEGGNVRELEQGGDNLPWNSRGMAWTTDSRRLLFLRGKQHAMAVWTVPTEGGEAKRTELTASSKFLMQLGMHPDGKRIAFVESDSTSEVWAMDGFAAPSSQTIRARRR